MFRHGSTYSGHPTCCAAALANIELLERDGLLQRGREQEQALFDALAPLADDELVAEVRGGVGTMAAVELTLEARERYRGISVHPLEGRARGRCHGPPGGQRGRRVAAAHRRSRAFPTGIAQAIEHGLRCCERTPARQPETRQLVRPAA